MPFERDPRDRPVRWRVCRNGSLPNLGNRTARSRRNLRRRLRTPELNDAGHRALVNSRSVEMDPGAFGVDVQVPGAQWALIVRVGRRWLDELVRDVAVVALR